MEDDKVKQINRRDFLKKTGVGAAALALPGVFTFCTSSPKKSNIVLVITDDQGYGDLSCHGSPDVKTPNLDGLYNQSTRFTNFHVSPTCAPTRSAIMSGKCPFKNGVTHTVLERERMALSTTTVADVLKSASYATGIFGKWHLGDEHNYQPGQRGFDEVFIHGGGGIGQAYPGTCADVPENKYFDPVIKHNNKFVKTRGFCTDVFFKQALSWIKEKGKSTQPFFTYLTLNAPHAPFIAPENYKKKFIEQGYPKNAQGFYGMIENIDYNMGILLEKLDAWGLRENTVLIFMTDNGSAWGGHNSSHGPTYNADMKGSKGTVHEGGTRVPFFIRWPGKATAGRDIDTLAAHIDILPTLAEMAGADISQLNDLDGRSLAPLIENPKSAWNERFLFFHKGRWKKYVENSAINSWFFMPKKDEANPDNYKYDNYAVRSQNFRLVNKTELYDYSHNHNDVVNVIDKYPEIASKMQEAYDKWWDEVRPFMVNEDETLEKEKPFHVQYNKQVESTGIPDWIEPDFD